MAVGEHFRVRTVLTVAIALGLSNFACASHVDAVLVTAVSDHDYIVFIDRTTYREEMGSPFAAHPNVTTKNDHVRIERVVYALEGGSAEVERSILVDRPYLPLGGATAREIAAFVPPGAALPLFSDLRRSDTSATSIDVCALCHFRQRSWAHVDRKRGRCTRGGRTQSRERSHPFRGWGAGRVLPSFRIIHRERPKRAHGRHVRPRPGGTFARCGH
jgi:hypothetical protein